LNKVGIEKAKAPLVLYDKATSKFNDALSGGLGEMHALFKRAGLVDGDKTLFTEWNTDT